MGSAMSLPPVKMPSPELLAKVHALKGKKGMFAVIEPDSGRYFLGQTHLEAAMKAREHYADKVFYSIRIGYPYVDRHRGGIKKI